MLTDYILQIPQTVYGGLHALENIPKVIQGAKRPPYSPIRESGAQASWTARCP